MLDAVLKPDLNRVQQEVLNTATAPITDEIRMITLNKFIQHELSLGGKIHMKADFEVTIVRKRRVGFALFIITNLMICLIVTIFTLSAYTIPWIPIFVIWSAKKIKELRNREKTQTIGVDKSGMLYVLQNGKRYYKSF
ncbi:MAG: hypothetical protein ACKOCG_01490 [Candidatus Nanopelagicus sp.]